ncbi:MAG: ROK family protein, partial [Bryobacteraceae bacterium]
PILCVDIGGTSTKAAILEPGGQLNFIHSIDTVPGVERYFGALVDLIRQVRNRAPDVSEMGISVAGFLDDGRTRLIYNPNIKWLENFPLHERLCQSFPDLRIELEVDSNAAAMAEYCLGSGREHRRFLCVVCGTGLGVGMSVDGAPLRFTYGCLGDIGHVIVDRNGPLCSCGGRGCAEAMIGALALVDRFRSLAHPHEAVTLQTVIERAGAGDQRAAQVIVQAGEWLGVALASIANMLFPDHIAIAGGLSAAGDLLIAPASRVFQDLASTAVRQRATITRATLGPLASLSGAAWPFWRHYPAKDVEF